MNVVISSGGRRGALVKLWQRELAEAGGGDVIVADASKLTAAGRIADAFVEVPRIDDPAFLKAMLELCREREAALIAPTLDLELRAYAASRDSFDHVDTTVLVSAPDVIEIGTDKLKTAMWLEEQGFPSVPTALLSDVDPDGPSSDVDPGGPSWDLPWIVKPRHGSASIGLQRIDDLTQLAAFRGDDVVVQALLQGHEYTVDGWVDRQGRCRCVVPRRRIEIRAGEVAKAVTVRDERIEVLARAVFERLPGAYGALNVQLLTNDDGLHVIEINPRFGGGYPLSWQAGARFPRWAIEERRGDAPTVTNDWLDGLVMLRYDEAVFVSATDVGL